MILNFIEKIFLKSNIDLMEYVCFPLILLFGIVAFISFLFDFIFVY